eukprot:TRINITY_DN31067_c0_g2_i1.p1 TRINITY_DN31067_c0_g2~~TRINITY_DN31067_c0_g2_i1.p1  ORF type:complete len:606 (+),score=173.56 TRINITY_DN31067_c0_g2_i1:59-1876(+)
MSGEKEDPVDEGEVEKVEPGSTHDPFAFKLLVTVKTVQAANGLRHNDHLRYRQYCSRRLRRLYKALGFKHGRGRYKKVDFPENFDDWRWLLIPLVLAERSWSYGVQLKSDNANAATFSCRWRHHSIQRLSKAVSWGKKLEAVCKVHCDARSQLEAEAYVAFLEGTYLLEKELWTEALTKLQRCRKLCERLGVAAEQAESAIFKAHREELAPMMRECRYRLGIDDEDDDDDTAKASTSTGKKKQAAKGSLSYRGHGLAMPDKISTKLQTCLESASTLKAEADSDRPTSSAANEKYGQLNVKFMDLLRDIHAEMIAVGADGEQDGWRHLEAYAREISICVNAERNMILLQNILSRLDELEEVNTSESRRVCRLEEGMRFCELLSEDMDNLLELPETSGDLKATLQEFKKIAANYRCLFLALCQTLLGKNLEAASLLDMLNSRVMDEDSNSGKKQPEPVARLQKFFEEVQQSLPSRVSQWRCRGLARLCKESKALATQGKGEAKEAAAAEQKGVSTDAGALSTWPPKFRDIPCKPLLFDLAFPLIDAPAIQAMLPGKAKAPASAEGQKAGLAGRLAGGLAGAAGGIGNKLGGAAGGLGNKLGGWLGRK